jgi:hypothetical protein
MFSSCSQSFFIISVQLTDYPQCCLTASSFAQHPVAKRRGERPRKTEQPDYRASRAVHRVHPSVLLGLSFSLMCLQASEM